MPVGGALTRLLTAQRPARAVALCRIGIGLAALIRGLKTGRDLFLLRGDEFVPAPMFEWSPELRTTPVILLFTAIWVIASLGLIAGYRARIFGFVLFACTVLQHLVDQNLWANHMYFLGLLVLLISLADSDASLSIRWLREGRPTRDITAWPATLLQIQLSIVYFYTAAAKLNEPFLSGQYLAGQLSVPAMLHSAGLMRFAAFGTVGTEFFLCFAFWIRPLRHWAFLIGFVFHLLIPVTMNLYAGLVAFSVMTLSVYVLFLKEPEQSRLVIWDDGCSFCGWWVRRLRRLDWLRIHRFEGLSSRDALAEMGITRSEADDEIKVWDGRRVYGGFDAVREILKYLPVGFLWAQALALPGIRWIGVRAYRAVARRRMCLTRVSGARVER